MENTITSRNGRLEVGMTRESLQQRISAQGMSESDRAAKELMKAFEMADGLGDEGVKDGVISEKEIEAYDKEMRKKDWITGLSIAGGVLLTAATTYLAIKGIKSNKVAKKVAEEARKVAEATKAAEEARKAANVAALKKRSPLYQEAYRLFKSGALTNGESFATRLPSGTRISFKSDSWGEELYKIVKTRDGRTFTSTFSPITHKLKKLQYEGPNLGARNRYISFWPEGNSIKDGHIFGRLGFSGLEYRTTNVDGIRHLFIEKQAQTAEKSAKTIKELYDLMKPGNIGFA